MMHLNLLNGILRTSMDPVASGMYVERITSGGEEKVLKIALVQETQVLKYY